MVNAFGCLCKSPQTVTLPETNSELTPGKYAFCPKKETLSSIPTIYFQVQPCCSVSGRVQYILQKKLKSSQSPRLYITGWVIVSWFLRFVHLLNLLVSPSVPSVWIELPKAPHHRREFAPPPLKPGVRRWCVPPFAKAVDCRGKGPDPNDPYENGGWYYGANKLIHNW